MQSLFNLFKTNNNNKTIIINKNISKYLQKYIIQILCKFINQYLKKQDEYSDQNETNEIKILIKSLSLVNKEWAEMLTSSVNVHQYKVFANSVFKSSDDGGGIDYSILKNENCKYLKMNLHNLITPTLFEKTNRLSNVKAIIIENISSYQKNYLFPCLNNLQDIGVTNKIYLNSLSLDSKEHQVGSFIYTLKRNKVCKINTLIISQNTNEEKMFQVFSTWSNSIKNIKLYAFRHYLLNMFQLLSPRQETGNINYLENIQSISFYKTDGLSLDMIIPVLKFANNLKEFSTCLCFQKLAYYLHEKEERDKLGIKDCGYCVLNFSGYQNEFSNDWSLICELFKSNKTLEKLTLIGTCNPKVQINYLKIENEISNLVSSIVSLKEFSMFSYNHPEIFKSIVEKNKSITNFNSIINYTDNPKSSKLIFNQLISTNSHITNFKFQSYLDINNIERKDFINFKK